MSPSMGAKVFLRLPEQISLPHLITHNWVAGSSFEGGWKMDHMMLNFICQLDWDMGCPDILVKYYSRCFYEGFFG